MKILCIADTLGSHKRLENDKRSPSAIAIVRFAGFSKKK